MKIKRENVATFIVRHHGSEVEFTMKNGDKFHLQMGISMSNGVESLTIYRTRPNVNRLHSGVCDLYSAIKPSLTKFEKSKTKENKEAILLKLIEIWNELIPGLKRNDFTIDSPRLMKKKTTPKQKGFWPKQIKEIQIGKTVIKTKDLNKLL